MQNVHIVISDRGWILENLAKLLSNNISGVTYDTANNPLADIQYYMTYNTWVGRLSPYELGFFTHIEESSPDMVERFYTVARKLDCAVCMSSRYSEALVAAGIENVQTISPGIDLTLFRPRLRIGVVGRAYHTGRKGEELMRQLLDIPDVEWAYTGSGWPLPATHLANGQLPEFYRGLDYLLVPSSFEGGPMSVIEALACGTEVIAPDVGWVKDYPHIPYSRNDLSNLRAVIQALKAKKQEAAASVAHAGETRWIDGHVKLFASLPRASKSFHLAGHNRVFTKDPKPKIALLTHGKEDKAKGGPSTRVPQTAYAMTRSGLTAKWLQNAPYDPSPYDIVHIFNIWHPDSCRVMVEQAKRFGKRVVLSPILLDLSQRPFFERDLPSVFHATSDPRTINYIYEQGRRQQQGNDGTFEKWVQQFTPIVRPILQQCGALISLSQKESDLIRIFGGANAPTPRIVHNPVAASVFAEADPTVFKEKFGVTDYVLCVGRIEARKNQLTLLYALRGMKIPIVLVGDSGDKSYYDLVRSYAGPDVIFTGHIEANSALLASAYAGARTFCLPSWAEGAPLAALEAAAAGVNMVLSNRSGEEEYFGERARYIDPCDPDGIRNAVLAAYEEGRHAEEDIAQNIRKIYSWESHIENTLTVYKSIWVQGNAGVLQEISRAPKRIYLDVTTSAYKTGTPTGIARVEREYAIRLSTNYSDQFSLVAWSGAAGAFLPVSIEQYKDGSFKELIVNGADSVGKPELNKSVEFTAGDLFLVLGGAWIRNSRYVTSLRSLRCTTGIKLACFIYDMIQVKFPHWFPEGVGAEFGSNAEALIGASDLIFVSSESARDDILEHCRERALAVPEIKKVRFGDALPEYRQTEYFQYENVRDRIGEKNFVLCVSAIDIRKNHQLLYNIWQRMIVKHGSDTPHLVLIGSKGWGADVVASQIERDERVRPYIHILYGINDCTLEWLYKNALFTVYPSFYEGWGLPVAESLYYGKICIAGAASSVLEISPNLTDLIDPLDFDAWFKRIEGYAFSRFARQTKEENIVQHYKKVTWEMAADDLANNILNTRFSNYQETPPIFPLFKWVSIDAQRDPSPKELILFGWYPVERGLVWSRGNIGHIITSVPGGGVSNLFIQLRGYPFSVGSEKKSYRIVVNGQVAREFTGAENDPCVLIPGVDGRRLEIAVVVDKPDRPAAQGKGNDQRLLGFALKGIRISCLELDQRETEEIVQPPAWFSEQAYREAYVDVDEAVISGIFQSAYSHFLQHGMLEGRLAGINV